MIFIRLFPYLNDLYNFSFLYKIILFSGIFSFFFKSIPFYLTSSPVVYLVFSDFYIFFPLSFFLLAIPFFLFPLSPLSRPSMSNVILATIVVARSPGNCHISDSVSGGVFASLARSPGSSRSWLLIKMELPCSPPRMLLNNTSPYYCSPQTRISLSGLNYSQCFSEVRIFKYERLILLGKSMNKE